MNHVLLSFLVIIAAGAFMVASADDDCCSFPTGLMNVATNVTARNFKCTEPIFIQCAVTAMNGMNRVGIAGMKSQAETSSFDILTDANWVISNTLVCNPSTISWHLKGAVAEYQYFTCAYRGDSGPWQLAF